MLNGNRLILFWISFDMHEAYIQIHVDRIFSFTIFISGVHNAWVPAKVDYFVRSQLFIYTNKSVCIKSGIYTVHTIAVIDLSRPKLLSKMFFVPQHTYTSAPTLIQIIQMVEYATAAAHEFFPLEIQCRRRRRSLILLASIHIKHDGFALL